MHALMSMTNARLIVASYLKVGPPRRERSHGGRMLQGGRTFHNETLGPFYSFRMKHFRLPACQGTRLPVILFGVCKIHKEEGLLSSIMYENGRRSAIFP